MEGSTKDMVGGQGAAGDADKASPKIGEQENRGQTQSPPHPGDVGVPSDEQLKEEDAGEGD